MSLTIPYNGETNYNSEYWWTNMIGTQYASCLRCFMLGLTEKRPLKWYLSCLPTWLKRTLVRTPIEYREGGEKKKPILEYLTFSFFFCFQGCGYRPARVWYYSTFCRPAPYLCLVSGRFDYLFLARTMAPNNLKWVLSRHCVNKIFVYT